MSGLTIIGLTLLTIAGIILAIVSIFKLYEYAMGFYHRKGNTTLKVVFFLPFVALMTICIIIDTILNILLGMALISEAKNARDWWHKGK